MPRLFFANSRVSKLFFHTENKRGKASRQTRCSLLLFHSRLARARTLKTRECHFAPSRVLIARYSRLREMHLGVFISCEMHKLHAVLRKETTRITRLILQLTVVSSSPSPIGQIESVKSTAESRALYLLEQANAEISRLRHRAEQSKTDLNRPTPTRPERRVADRSRLSRTNTFLADPLNCHSV